jgi:hypothetical protein
MALEKQRATTVISHAGVTIQYVQYSKYRTALEYLKQQEANGYPGLNVFGKVSTKV